MFDLLIIGAGASGLTAAITAKKRGKSVLLLEKNDSLGKKILSTGNGRCNFTNRNMSSDFYHGDKALIDSVLGEFPVEAAIDYFRQIGIFAQEKNGYFYPFSNQAKAVVKAFEEQIEGLDIPVEFLFEISQIKNKGDSFTVISKSGKKFSGKNLLFASGAIDSKGKGLDDSAFPFVEALGHSIHKFLPALCGFSCKGADFKRISGVRSNANIKLFVDGKQIAEDYGEIQFTDYGLSGILVFQLSAPAARALDERKKVSFVLDFIPDFNRDELSAFLTEKKEKGADLLNGLVPDKLGKEILYLAKQDGGDLVSAVLRMLGAMNFEVREVRDFKFAQTACGGILADQIKNESLESKLVPGLYFSGELLDVDGICGGYNLHWAWATGRRVGNSI